MKNLAPILLFTYKRIDTLKLTVSALKNNFLSRDSELFVFSDGPKNSQDFDKVKIVREYLKTISGFKNVVIYESNINKGLAQSVIDGVSEVISTSENVIVLEDDLVTTKNFLTFMNSSLKYYAKEELIFSVAGYTPPITEPLQDVYFTKRASSWGWATWRNRWDDVDWGAEEFNQLQGDPLFKREINQMGSDMYKMLNDQMQGKINSWAIRWCFHQYLTQKFTVFPTLSKVENIGTGGDATHTADRFDRFKTNMDETNKTEFDFHDVVRLDKYYLKQFLKQFSLYNRIKYKILNSIRF